MNNVTSSVFYTCLHIGARDHNEYIVPRAFWEANLPNIIEAVFCRTDCGRARQVHQAFLDAYGLTDQQTPLLYYGMRPSDDGFRFAPS
jgi:hypothetical protein